MPAALHVFHDLWKRFTSPLPLEHELEVLPLNVTYLGDDDELVAPDRFSGGERNEDLADAGLASSVRVIRGGIDKVAALGERFFQGLLVFRRLIIDAVATESDRGGGPLRPSKLSVGGFRQPPGFDSFPTQTLCSFACRRSCCHLSLRGKRRPFAPARQRLMLQAKLPHFSGHKASRRLVVSGFASYIPK